MFSSVCLSNKPTVAHRCVSFSALQVIPSSACRMPHGLPVPDDWAQCPLAWRAQLRSAAHRKSTVHPLQKTRSMREIKLNWFTTNSKRTQDNNISGVNIHLTLKCLLEILWWKLFTLISVVSDAVSCHCALNSTTHQTALLPRRSPTSHTLHSSWCCWRGVLWHSSRGSASTMGGMFRWAFLAAGGWFARVKRAQSLRLMGLTLTIQELVQNLHKDNIKH